VHLAYIWIVSHLSAKNYRNFWKFDKVLTKTNLLSFFWDTVYMAHGPIIKFANIQESSDETRLNMKLFNL